MSQTISIRVFEQIFRIGTVRYAEGLERMRRHWPVIAHCTDLEVSEFSCTHLHIVLLLSLKYAAELHLSIFNSI